MGRAAWSGQDRVERTDQDRWLGWRRMERAGVGMWGDSVGLVWAGELRGIREEGQTMVTRAEVCVGEGKAT